MQQQTMRERPAEQSPCAAPAATVQEPVRGDAWAVRSAYRNALRDISTVIEDHALFLDVLGNNDAADAPQWRRRIASGVRKRIADLSGEMNVHMPGTMAPFHRVLLSEALNSGDLDTVDYALGELVRHAPEAESLRPLFEDAVRRGKIRRDDAGQRLARYRLEFLARVDFHSGCVPMDLHFSKQDGTLCVVDMKNACIRRVSAKGVILGELSPGLRQPQGCFSGEGTGFWVCDTGNGRLVGLDEQGGVAAEVDFRRFMPEAAAGAGPRFGCSAAGRLHVVLENARTKGRLLVSLRPDDPAGTLQRIPGHEGVSPLRVFRFGDSVFLYDWPGDEATKLDPAAGRQSPLPRGFRRPLVRGLEPVGGHAFLLSDDRIIKITPDGSPVFNYELAEAAGVTGIAPLAMATGLFQGRRRLAVSDGVSGSVFLFGI